MLNPILRCLVLAAGVILIGSGCAHKTQEASALKPFVINHHARTNSDVDVSFLLEAPAGKDGFIRVQDGHLVKPDGKRFRIWGVNLTGWTRGSTLLPPKEEAPLWAAEMARLGINCARFHFLDLPIHDSSTTNVGGRRIPAGLIAAGDTSQELDPDALDRLDFFIAELKKRGIYANLNLNVGRRYRKGDGVPDHEFIQRAATKGMTYVGDRLLELQRDYARKLLTHYNPYTRSEYRNEPAVACVEILNENSLLEFWSRNWLQGKLTADHPAPQLDFSPHYEKILTEMYQKWLAQHRTPEQLAQLRKLAGVSPGEAIPRTRRQEFRDCPTELFHTEAEFYMSVEQEFFLGMKSYLQEELGVKSLIVGTADHTYFIPNQPLIHTTAQLDIVDGHVYWEHPAIWGHRNTPMVNAPLDSTIVKLSRSAVAGKPYTVSEVNHPNPNEYCAEMIPLLAAYGAFQDWDGIYFYTFEPKVGKKWEPFVADHFDITLDPVKMTQMSVGALLFSRPDVAAAQQVVARTFSTAQVYESCRLSEHERPYFTPGFPLSIPLHHGSRIKCFDCEPTATFADDLEPPYVSDTRELVWHNSKPAGGVVSIETERTQGLIGFVRDNPVEVRHLKPEVKNDFCAITLSSLTSEPIWKSSKLLLTACSRWQNTGSKWNERRTMWGEGPRSKGWGSGPTLIEPVTGWITLRGLEGAVQVELVPLDGAARPIGKPIRGKLVEEGYEIPLGNPATPWYLVRVKK
jgi:hypothetical protein